MFTGKWSLDLWMIVAFFATLLPYLLLGSFEYSTFRPFSIMGLFFLFFIGMFMFHYYRFHRKDISFLAKLSIITVIFYTIGSIQTYLGLSKYPNAARFLAIGEMLAGEYRELYNSIGIGDFNFVYSSCFLSIALIYCVLREKIPRKVRMLFLVALVSIILMIFKASYAISILIMLAGFFIVLISKSKTTLYYILTVMLTLLLLIPDETMGNMVFRIASLFEDNSVIYEKLTDLANSFLYPTFETQTDYRLELYTTSLKTFLQRPIFGINGPLGKGKLSIGNHSGWLDMLAYFGLFSTLPLILAVYKNFRKIKAVNTGKRSYGLILTVQLIFIIYGIINPLFYIYQIGLIVFLIVPSIPYIRYLRSKIEISS